jgi:hypothetical protein
MPGRIRRVGKWILRGLIFGILLEGLHITAVAVPFPVFRHKTRFDEFTVYSRKPLPENFAHVIDDARLRVEAMEHAHPGAKIRVYLCDTEKLYSFFAFLIRRSSDSFAIGLSIFDNMYLNETKIRNAANSDGWIRHSRFEGNYAEVIAHEIVHFNIVDKSGYRAAMRMPVWKGEGYAEYQANLAATRADSSYDFTERIALLRNGLFWGGNSQARSLFEWHLLVEYLAEIEGYVLTDLIDEGVTEESARASMLAWYEAQGPAGQ